MYILILGGTGAMGTHLTRILSNEKGIKLTVTSRKYRPDNGDVEYAQGNAHDMFFLEPLLSAKPWDVIVDFMVYDTEEFRQRVQHLLCSTKQYVYLSSSRVYAESAEPITEDSPRLLDVCNDFEYLITDEYALTKARQEDILRESGYKNWTIIRPYITFSEIRLQLSPMEKENWLFRALHGRSIVFSKDLACKRTTLTYGYDVARGIAAIINRKEALGETFHITADENHTWAEVLEIYLEAIERNTGCRPKVVMNSKWQPYHGGGLSQVKYDRMYNRIFDNSKISRFINTSTFKPTLQALSDCIDTFVKHPTFQYVDAVSEAYKDRLANEITPVTQIPGGWQKVKYLLVRFGIVHRYEKIMQSIL